MTKTASLFEDQACKVIAPVKSSGAKNIRTKQTKAAVVRSDSHHCRLASQQRSSSASRSHQPANITANQIVAKSPLDRTLCQDCARAAGLPAARPPLTADCQTSPRTGWTIVYYISTVIAVH